MRMLVGTRERHGWLLDLGHIPIVPNAMAVGVHPASEDLSSPRPISLPPLVVPPVGARVGLVVVDWLSGRAVGTLLVLEGGVAEAAGKDVGRGCSREGSREGALDGVMDSEVVVVSSLPVGLAGARTGGGGGGGGSVVFGEWVFVFGE